MRNKKRRKWQNNKARNIKHRYSDYSPSVREEIKSLNVIEMLNVAYMSLKQENNYK